MKNNLSVLSLIFGLFICVTVISACSSDDETSSGGNSGSSKHIAKIISEEEGYFYEYSYTYDAQGRVTKVIKTTSATSFDTYSETTYQYGETTIISKMIEERTYSSGQINSHSESHSYTLENGLIVKDKEIQGSSTRTDTFSYDSNNCLSSISSNGSNIRSETKIIRWSNGNLIKLGDRSYEYSSYPWPKGFPFSLKGSNMDANLFAIGYYGNIPKNLPSKYTYSETSGFTCEYSFEGGYVTKVVTTAIVETNKNQINISTIIWE